MLRHKFLIKKWNVWNDPTFNAICFIHPLYFIWHGAKLWTYFLLKSSILNWIVGNKLAPARLMKSNLFVIMRYTVSCNMNNSQKDYQRACPDIKIHIIRHMSIFTYCGIKMSWDLDNGWWFKDNKTTISKQVIAHSPNQLKDDVC